jgi:hypothetical protein
MSESRLVQVVCRWPGSCRFCPTLRWQEQRAGRHKETIGIEAHNAPPVATPITPIIKGCGSDRTARGPRMGSRLPKER